MVWTVISNGQIDTDSPVTQPLMTALRDNLPSAFAGDAGGPRLRASAHGTPAAGGGRAGGIVNGGGNLVQSTAFTGSMHVGSWSALANGVVRVSYFHYMNSPIQRQCAVDIYKNGALVSTRVTTSTSPVQRLIDVAVAAGDCLSVGLRVINVDQGSSGSGNLFDVIVLCNLSDPVVGA